VNHAIPFKNCVTLTEIMKGTLHCNHSVTIKIKNKMNTIEVKGNWNEQKGKLKQKYANLTDNDLMFAEGKKDEMLGKLQIKLGKTKEEMHAIIAAL
jgi:uncharacterized protein YjbJ (UPF0337 family)